MIKKWSYLLFFLFNFFIFLYNEFDKERFPMKNIKNWFTNISLYKKILLIVSVTLLCSYGFFFISLQFLTRQYDKELYQTNAGALSHVSSAITAEMQVIETIASNVMSDSVIQENLSLLKEQPAAYQSALAKREIYNTLYPHAFYNGYIKSINIILEDGTNICMGSSAYLEAFDKERLHEQSMSAQGRMVWESPLESGSDIAGARQIRQLKYLKLTNLADLYIVVDLELLIQDALKRSGYSPADSDFILFSGVKAIYPNPLAEENHFPTYNALLSEMDASGLNYMVSDEHREKAFIISGSIPYAGWRYLFIRNYNPIFYNIVSAKFQVMLISACCALLALVLVRLIFARIFRHLDFLILKIQCFGDGKPLPEDCQSYDYELRQDEIGQLHRSFDQMTKSVKVLRDENYDKQILLRDATIKMLQQQIHPHFLYNTLDTINCMAQQYGADDISTMVCSLASLFRSAVIGKEDVIPLADELKVLENYSRIQEIRFRDRLNFILTVPEDISHIFVPKLCIQPLVENALKHALEYTDELCTIHVSVSEQEEHYHITVANTGSRFEEDLLQKIESRQITPQGSGVGLVNIDSRMKLLYGEDYGLNCYNEEGMAVVMLRIPKEKRD